mgnify:CR=1 FL=1
MYPGFTHVDPFEDTERSHHSSWTRRACLVSPTSIRSRILKETIPSTATKRNFIVSPTSIRSRILKGCWRPHCDDASGCVSPTSIRSRILKDNVLEWRFTHAGGFTHVDPFEDTESHNMLNAPSALISFTHVDPFEDTESARLLHER